MPGKTFIEVNPEEGKNFFQKPGKGEVIMLNLLKFKEIADYSEFPHLQIHQDISGERAYELYMQNTLPFLKKAGSELLFQGKCNAFLIGPQTEKWDLMLLVKHASKEAFLKFASNEDYLKIAGHRTAALKDSRLLPIDRI